MEQNQPIPPAESLRHCAACTDDLNAATVMIENAVRQFREVHGASVFSSDGNEPIVGGSIHPYGAPSYAAAVSHYLHKSVPGAYLLLVGMVENATVDSQMSIGMWQLGPEGTVPLSKAGAHRAYMESNRLKPTDRQMQKYAFISAEKI